LLVVVHSFTVGSTTIQQLGTHPCRLTEKGYVHKGAFSSLCTDEIQMLVAFFIAYADTNILALKHI
jgi:hypothetical protein